MDAPFCPHLTTAQIVARGFAGQLTPIGEARAQEDMAALGQSMRRPKSMGGLALSAVGGKVLGPVYKAEFGGQFKAPEGTSPNDVNVALIPDAAMVACQRELCAFWCVRHQECRDICNRCKVETFALALQQFNQEAVTAAAVSALENAAGLIRSTTQKEGLEAPKESDHDDPHPEPGGEPADGAADAGGE